MFISDNSMIIQTDRGLFKKTPGLLEVMDCAPWGRDGRVVWGADLSSCDLQVEGSIPIAFRFCDPLYHPGFGDWMVRCIYDCERQMISINGAMVGNWAGLNLSC